MPENFPEVQFRQAAKIQSTKDNTSDTTSLNLLCRQSQDLLSEPLPTGPRSSQDVELKHSADFIELALLSRRLDLNVVCQLASNAELRHIDGMKNIVGLDLSKTAVTDAGLSHLEKLSGLKNLSLRLTEVSDKGMDSIAKIGSLKNLDLTNTGVGVHGLQRLKSLSNLETLSLGANEVSAAELGVVKDMPRLQSLYLSGKVNPDDLKQLAGCSKLSFISVLNSDRLSDWESLSKTLKNCTIYAEVEGESPLWYRNGNYGFSLQSLNR